MINYEPQEDPRTFMCDNNHDAIYSIEVIHILNENGIEYEGKCHHCLYYDGDLIPKVFDECFENEDI